MSSNTAVGRPAQRGRIPSGQNRVYTALRVSPEIRARIEERATAENRTVSAMIETLLARALDAQDAADRASGDE